MSTLFISYRRSDTEQIVGRIHDRLTAAFGDDHVFIDTESIPFGVDFVDYIDRTVGEAKVMLAIVGPGWLDARDEHGRRRLDNPNDFVRLEIETAIRRGIPLGAVRIGSTTAMPLESDLPDSLHRFCRRNASIVEPGRDFHPHMDRLIVDLRRHLEDGAKATSAAAPTKPAPKQAVTPTAPAKPAAATTPSATPADGGVAATVGGLMGSLFKMPSAKPVTPASQQPPPGPPHPKPVAEFKGLTGMVLSLAISPDGRYLLSGNGEQDLCIWDVASGRRVAQLEGIAPVTIDMCDDAALIAGYGGGADVVSVPDGQRLRTLAQRDFKTSLARWLPDGRSVVVAKRGHWLERRDAETGAELWRIRLPNPPAGGDVNYVFALAVHPDGRSVVAGSSNNQTLSRHETQTGDLLDSFGPGYINAAAFSPDGQTLAFTDANDIHIVAAADLSKPLAELSGHSFFVKSLAFSPDGRWLVSGSQDKTVRAWAMAAGGKSTVLGRRAERIAAVAVSPDGRWAASGGGRMANGKDFTIRTWPLPS